ncbi:MAG: hypothetical protein ACR2QF_11165, partial [Geminicoccaceae bacterium]
MTFYLNDLIKCRSPLMSDMHHTLRRRVHLAFLMGSTALTLAACGGGGGGGNGGQTNPGVGNPAFFESQEFLTSEALQQINASEGYALIPGVVGGSGVRVAILDDGIDADH